MTVKLGFVGTGGIASFHIKNLVQMEGVELAAFFDTDAQRAQKAASEHAGAKAFSNLDEMLDGSKLDGLYICVPPMAHGEAESKAIERGLPFLVEKPLGLDRGVPEEIARRVAEKKLLTAVGYHWRYNDTMAEAKRLLAESRTGMALGYWMGGMPMVPWWRVMKGSGGQFVEQTTHIVDLLRFLCGEVTEVYAAYALRDMDRQVPGTDVPDVGTVTFKLASGAVATVSNTCLLPVGHHVGLDVYTDRGVLEVRGNELKDITKTETRSVRNVSNPYYVEDEAFVHALRTGDSSRILSDYADALLTHEVTVAANESAAGGKPVAISSGAKEGAGA
ncbi:Gfo/Idh/MocA family oxidoreductase [Cohnella sp. CBP 2801]|uniref:Gfo/Idh/MocA family oxidoreductase n=1 Tax=Cohnella zeiphila TaxID=2761120 RepID=A0A7X0STU6_9BACL|nr:Gfo/Idh/MocA family oxidoreductase [Cohnella zeiphila]MBB6735991.1 Gfo/Idh/MocA family oxidoreductase [Cohnella zeiphila]